MVETNQNPEAPKATAPAVGLRKRQQIANSNKTMFLWVAGASVLVAFAIVLSVFLFKQIVFTEKVLIEKNNTIGKLDDNLEAASELDKNIAKLRANKDLTVVRSNASDNNLDVVIDAMPYAADDVALGSSLQTVLLTGASIDSLTVDSVEEDGGNSDIDTSTIATTGDVEPMTFSFKATGSSEQLEDVLDKLNRSIRPMYIVSLQLESAGSNKLTASVQAATYYQPAKKLELTDKVVKP